MGICRKRILAATLVGRLRSEIFAPENTLIFFFFFFRNLTKERKGRKHLLFRAV